MKKRKAPPPTGVLGDYADGDWLDVLVDGTWIRIRISFHVWGEARVRRDDRGEIERIDPTTPARYVPVTESPDPVEPVEELDPLLRRS